MPTWITDFFSEEFLKYTIYQGSIALLRLSFVEKLIFCIPIFFCIRWKKLPVPAIFWDSYHIVKSSFELESVWPKKPWADFPPLCSENTLESLLYVVLPLLLLLLLLLLLWLAWDSRAIFLCFAANFSCLRLTLEIAYTRVTREVSREFLLVHLFLATVLGRVIHVVFFRHSSCLAKFTVSLLALGRCFLLPSLPDFLSWSALLELSPCDLSLRREEVFLLSFSLAADFFSFSMRSLTKNSSFSTWLRKVWSLIVCQSSSSSFSLVPKCLGNKDFFISQCYRSSYR